MPPPNAKLLSAPIHNPPTPRLWDPTLRLPLQLCGGERSRGRAEEKPSLARVALTLSTLGNFVPIRPARACLRSPQPLAPGERRKKACVLRLYCHRFPVLTPARKEHLGTRSVTQELECQRGFGAGRRDSGREKGRRTHSRGSASRPDRQSSPRRTKVTGTDIATTAQQTTSNCACAWRLVLYITHSSTANQRSACGKPSPVS